MSNFRTTFNIPEFHPKMDYHSKSLYIGSCFTENIGNSLKNFKFQVIINPTGIIYNPISICESIQFLLDQKQFTESDLGYHNDTYFSFKHHSRYSDPDKNVCLKKINEDLQIASAFLLDADFLFITLGTAYIYTHNETKEVVANCHKFPSTVFSKSYTNVSSIHSNLEKTLKDLTLSNPKIKIIFTVSPVRHWHDGVIENQLSKSILITAIHEIISKLNTCSYFPAYELMMDDLRDYRFYAEDMIHPNGSATEYILNKYINTFITKEATDLMNDIKKILTAKNHKPFRTHTTAYREFQKKQLEQITELKRKYSFLDLVEFEEFFKQESVS